MKFTLLLAFSLIICYFERNPVTKGIQFPEDLKKWCPYTNFCGDSSVMMRQDQMPTNDSDTIPCCSACSCAKDCGRKRNCCRKEYDLYDLEESLGTVCKQLNTLTENIPRDEPFYHIIDKCPNRSEPCTSPNESIFLSYFPVYSEDSSMLYYNERCASCHKQNKIVSLNFVVSCEKLTVSYFPTFSAIMNGLTSSDCVLRFLVPEGIDIATEQCFPKTTTDCSPENPLFEKYSKACQHFNATFRTPKWTNYKNVYCYLCIFNNMVEQSQWIKANDFCPANQDRKNVLQSTMFMLLFDKYLSKEKESYDLNKEEYPIWCNDITKKHNCRRVLCPEGQDLFKGTCRFLGDKWRFKYFRMNVKLVLPTGTEFTINDLGISSDSSTNNVSLERPGFQSFNVAVLYNQDLNGTTIRYFVAMMSKQLLTVEPRRFIENTKISFQLKWKLRLNKRIITLTPEFHKNIFYEPWTDTENKVYHEPLPTNKGAGETANRNEMLSLIHADVPIDHFKELLEAVFLTKLFFCKVIELEQHEVKDKPPRLLLLNQSRYLESGEYKRTFDESGMLKARICLNDLYDISYSSKTKRNYFSSYIFVIVHLVFSRQYE